jgi:hypothetical protein
MNAHGYFCKHFLGSTKLSIDKTHKTQRHTRDMFQPEDYSFSLVKFL